MTNTVQIVRKPLEIVTFDFYRDIHKGIRLDLFTLTMEVGNADPSSRQARAAVAEHLDHTVELLVTHAKHEDAAIQPSIEQHLPDLAEQIERDHEQLEAWLVDVHTMAHEAVDAPVGGQRDAVHRLYVELASFTSAYLAHQDVEERDVMPALERAIGPDAVLGIHTQLIGGMAPQDLVGGLSVMFPAMNIDERAELLGGMRATAPAEAFEGVWGLAGSVLTPFDFAALGRRLDIAE